MDAHWLKDLPLSPMNVNYTINARGWLVGGALGAGLPGERISLRRKKVALIGASQIDKDERPPLDDPAWEVWSCNSLWKLCLDQQGRFRADRWFEMHPLSVQTEQERRDMEDCPVPLYVLDAPSKQNWIIYPLSAVRQRFGARDHFTCTMTYQLALALLEGYTTIGLWGMELWQGSARERTCELRGLEYWLGIAKGMGVEIVLPAYSCLIQHPHLYGYDYFDEDADAQGEVSGIVKQYVHEWQKTLNEDEKIKVSNIQALFVGEELA